MIMTQAHYPHARNYCRAWQAAKQAAATNPTAQITIFRGWFPEEARRVLAGFTDALHARINARGGITFAGRKQQDNYQHRLMHDCQVVRDHARIRLIVRPHDLSTPDVRRRFGHIITQPWEE
jgi:hypothetical protein